MSGKEGLWVPNNQHDYDVFIAEHYPAPSLERLCLAWKEYDPYAEMVQAPGVYGIVREPSFNESFTCIASIDLCEVIRETDDALYRMRGDTIWKHGVPDKPSYSGERFPDHVIGPLVTVLMNAGEVQPVEGIDKIALILQDWRDNGVYVVANTSTLPGCELATISFFRKYLPSSFDGILLPRNHDGTAAKTKGWVLCQLIEKINPGIRAVFHIDDVTHHIVGVHNELDWHPQFTTFTPGYHHNENVVHGTRVWDEVQPQLNPLRVFLKADQLVQQLITKS